MDHSWLVSGSNLCGLDEIPACDAQNGQGMVGSVSRRKGAKAEIQILSQMEGGYIYTPAQLVCAVIAATCGVAIGLYALVQCAAHRGGPDYIAVICFLIPALLGWCARGIILAPPGSDNELRYEAEQQLTREELIRGILARKEAEATRIQMRESEIQQRMEQLRGQRGGSPSGN